MDAAEYTNLDNTEQEHWYYSGKRLLVRRWLRRVRPPKPADVLLDYGAGTGAFAHEMQQDCQVLVLDDHEDSRKLLRRYFSADKILSPLADDRIPLPARAVDYVTALDVLEHVPNDRRIVDELSRITRPGGVLVATVPAGMALWSDWDVALHHFRRYNKRMLTGLFSNEEWETVYCNYTNVLVYPLVWAARRFRGRPAEKSEKSARPRAEDRIPPGWLNRLLRGLFVRTGLSPIRFPLGVSLILVARRR